MKNYEKLNKKNKLQSLIFVLFGICAILSTYVFEPIGEVLLVKAMGWSAAGVGILMFLLYTLGKNNKRIKDTTIAENDEMSADMRGKAGYVSYWATYGVLMISIIVVQYVNLSVTNFILTLLVGLPVIYFINLFRVVSKY